MGAETQERIPKLCWSVRPPQSPEWSLAPLFLTGEDERELSMLLKYLGDCPFSFHKYLLRTYYVLDREPKKYACSHGRHFRSPQDRGLTASLWVFDKFPPSL